MQFTPRISLLHATENRRIPPEELQLPHLERCVNMWTDLSGVLQVPFPTPDPPDYPDPPCPITSPVTSYEDFVTCGAYVVALGVNGEDRRIWWSAPARPTVWALTEVVDGVTVKTGAGWNDLAGDGTIFDYGNKSLGQSAAIYDSEGVGQLSLTGNWGQPFAYAKKVNSIVSYSEGFASEVDGVHYFCDQTGYLYGTDAATVAPVEGPFNLKSILAGGWPPYDAIPLWWDLDIQKLWAYASASSYYFLINPKNGNYQTKYASTEYFQTGALPLMGEDKASHIQYVDLEANVKTGDCDVTLAFRPTGSSTWGADVTYALPSGKDTTRFWINQTIESSPQMKLTLSNRTGTTEFYGFTVAFDDGGRR